MGLSFREDFFGLLTFDFDFGTFKIEFFLFGYCGFLEFVRFFRGDLDFFQDGFDLNFLGIDFFLLYLKFVTQNGDCFFGFFKFLETVLITCDHLGEIFVVGFEGKLIGSEEVQVILWSGEVFPLQFLFKLL